MVDGLSICSRHGIQCVHRDRSGIYSFVCAICFFVWSRGDRKSTKNVQPLLFFLIYIACRHASCQKSRPACADSILGTSLAPKNVSSFRHTPSPLIMSFLITGIVFTAQSGRIKARAIAASQEKEQNGGAGVDGEHDSTVDITVDSSCRDPEAGATPVAVNQGPSNSSGGGEGVSVPRQNGIELASSRHAAGASDGDKGTLNGIHVKGESSADGVANRSVSGALENSEEQAAVRKEAGSNHWAGVAVCVTGAVMSSMLQFSFVYGERGDRRLDAVDFRKVLLKACAYHGGAEGNGAG